MTKIKTAIVLWALVLLAGCAGGSAVTYQNMTVHELKNRMEQEDLFIVDVHIPEQRHIKGTDLFVPFDKITTNAEKFPADKDETIIVYCRSGNMSVDSSIDLVDMGYKNVFNVVEGINAWKAAGYPLE